MSPNTKHQNGARQFRHVMKKTTSGVEICFIVIADVTWKWNTILNAIAKNMLPEIAWTKETSLPHINTNMLRNLSIVPQCQVIFRT